MISKTTSLPVLTLEAALAPAHDPDLPLFRLVARHSVVRRVLRSNSRCSVYTHTLATEYPLGFDDPDPEQVKWTSHASVLHDPLDRLYLLLKATRYTRSHFTALWAPTTVPPWCPGS